MYYILGTVAHRHPLSFCWCAHSLSHCDIRPQHKHICTRSLSKMCVDFKTGIPTDSSLLDERLYVLSPIWLNAKVYDLPWICPKTNHHVYIPIINASNQLKYFSRFSGTCFRFYTDNRITSIGRKKIVYRMLKYQYSGVTF